MTFIYLFLYLFIHLFIDLFIHLFIDLFILKDFKYVKLLKMIVFAVVQHVVLFTELVMKEDLLVLSMINLSSNLHIEYVATVKNKTIGKLINIIHIMVKNIH